MTGFDIDSLMAIKDSFQGHNFQWVKSQDRAKLGKVVRVTDVLPGAKGRFIAQLSDGTQIPTDQLSSNLMMVMEDQPAMSMAEILSINELPSVSQEIQISPTIPEEFAQAISAKQVSPKPTEAVAQPQASRNTDPGDLFGMFSLEETDLPLTVSIKLPAKNLLKMMYVNSQNKEEFLDRLSAYINNNVTIDSIKSSIRKNLDPDKKKKS